MLIEELQSRLAAIQPPDDGWLRRARARQDRLTKPPGSLGRLEELGVRLAAIQRTETPAVRRPRIVLFAGDHGVCAEGVNPYPQAVTAQMVANFLRGGAAINAIARALDIELEIVNAGVANLIPGGGEAAGEPLARGTQNFCVGPAMSRDEALASLQLGIERAECAVAAGCTLLGMGEMGIGNTTAASALTALLTGRSDVVGRGTGADDACLARKRSAVARALALHAAHAREPMDALARLGGFEIGALCGLCLGAAACGCAVLMDGFIATSAAALATRFQPAVAGYLIAAHRSSEPGHAALLEMLGQRPLLELDLRLGEGTGAALAVPVARAAAATLSEMATFADAQVSGVSGTA